MDTYKIIPSFISKEEFLRSCPCLLYGTDEKWFAIMTPAEQVCARSLMLLSSLGTI